MYKHICEVTLLLSTLKKAGKLTTQEGNPKVFNTCRDRDQSDSIHPEKDLLFVHSTCYSQNRLRAAFVIHRLKTDFYRTIFNFFVNTAKVEGILAYPGALPIHAGSCTNVIKAIANVEGIIVCPRV